MVSYWIYKFTVEDRDIGVVDYESLDKTEIGFPLVSLCFKYPFLGNELKKINTSFSRYSYLQYLKGDIHDDQYEKIDYKNVTMDLDDYFIKSVFKLSNDSTRRTSFAKPAHKVIFNGFYAGKFRKCFETQVDKMETPKLQEITYEYDNTKLLRDLSFPPNRSHELPFNLHHTEQFLVKSSTAQWLYIKHGEEIKIGEDGVPLTVGWLAANGPATKPRSPWPRAGWQPVGLPDSQPDRIRKNTPEMKDAGNGRHRKRH